jgi:hypothetical protein
MPETGAQNAPQAAPSPWSALSKARGVQRVSSKPQGAFAPAILFGALSARNISKYIDARLSAGPPSTSTDQQDSGPFSSGYEVKPKFSHKAPGRPATQISPH